MSRKRISSFCLVTFQNLCRRPKLHFQPGSVTSSQESKNGIWTAYCGGNPAGLAPETISREIIGNCLRSINKARGVATKSEANGEK